MLLAVDPLKVNILVPSADPPLSLTTNDAFTELAAPPTVLEPA